MLFRSAIGISVTHRDHVAGVTLVTGHTKTGNSPNWKALVDSGTTLVIYMAIANIDAIVNGLTHNGMNANTPVAAIENATRADQRALTATLGTLARRVHDEKLSSPAIIVIGEVVAFASASLAAASLRASEHRADKRVA